jgi:Tol biopolymer transport system component
VAHRCVILIRTVSKETERPAPGRGPISPGRLDSWKEIASFLGRGIRTVQRWEREEQMPVRRLGHAKRGTVYADPAELSAWWESRRLTPAIATSPPPASSGATAGLVRVTQTTTVTGFPSLSSDARLVAFVADDELDGGAPQIWIQQIGGGAIQLTRGQRDCSDPSFSADDTRVIYSAKGETSHNIYEVPALGGQPRLLKKSARSARMSPDGRWLAYIPLDSPGGLHVTAVDGSQDRLIASSLIDIRSVAWSRDSLRLVVYSHPDPADEPDYWVVPLDGGAEVCTGLTRTLRSQGFSVFVPLPAAWVHGALLFSAVTREGVNVWRQRIAPETFAPAGLPERLTLGTEMAWFCTSAAGRMAFITTRFDMNLWSVALDESSGTAYGPLRRLTRGPGVLGHLSVTGTGRMLAYFVVRPGSPRIVLRDLERGSETIATLEPANEEWGYPAISPSGAQLAYSTRSTGPRTMRPVYVADPAGGQWRQVCEDSGGRPWQWQDERFILIETFGARLNVVARVDTTTGEVSALLASAERSINNPRVSPDGAWVAFDAALPWGSPTVYVAPLRGPGAIPESDWIAIDRAASHPCWSRDGRVVYYLPAAPNLEIRDAVRARRLEPITNQPDGDSFIVLELKEMLVPTFLNGTAPLVAPDQILLVLGDFRGDIWIRDL